MIKFNTDRRLLQKTTTHGADKVSMYTVPVFWYSVCGGDPGRCACERERERERERAR